MHITVQVVLQGDSEFAGSGGHAGQAVAECASGTEHAVCMHYSACERLYCVSGIAV